MKKADLNHSENVTNTPGLITDHQQGLEVLLPA